MKRVMMLVMVIGMMVSLQANVFGSLEGTVFQLVDDFEGYALGAKLSGVSCAGTSGGYWDQETDDTSNVKIRGANPGNQYYAVWADSNKKKRGMGFAGVTNSIGNTQHGVAFFRFQVDSDARPVSAYLGMHDLTLPADNKFMTGTTCVPASINAGFELYRSGTSGNYAIRTVDGVTELESDLMAGSWYNAWIAADNATNTFDLYIKAVAAPGGAVELPTDADKIGNSLSFSTATDNAISGFMLCQGTTAQGPGVNIDDMYWSVPEPVTLILLGLGGVALIRKR